MDSTTSQPTLKCAECGQPIVGAFWSSIKGERKDYHVQCKPIFYFMHGKEIPAYPKDYRVTCPPLDYETGFNLNPLEK